MRNAREQHRKKYRDSPGAIRRFPREKDGCIRRTACASMREGLLVLLYQPFFGGPDCNLCSGMIAQLGKDVANVRFNRAFGDEQRISNLVAGLSTRDSHGDFTLAFGQSVIGPLRGAPGRRWRHERDQVMHSVQEIYPQQLSRHMEGELFDNVTRGKQALFSCFVAALSLIAFPEGQVDAPEQG